MYKPNAHLLYDSEGCFASINELKDNEEIVKIIDVTGSETKAQQHPFVLY
ncbi:hypothetical protein OAV26_01375 [Crocinitomicaceae bacterium]|nr:hypothetical protein [Crocinitomicaceae bacterium]